MGGGGETYLGLMHIFVMVALVGAGLLNLAAVVGVGSAARLASGYGVVIGSPDLEILLRHRAVLLGIVGALLIASAFHPPLRWAAIVGGLVSMISFVLVARGVGGHGSPIGRVAGADIAGAVLLAVGAVAELTIG